jgi:hypothetical protein
MPISTTAYLVVLGKERILEFGRAADTAPECGAAALLSMGDLQQMFKGRFGL